MSSQKRFMTRSEYGRNKRRFLLMRHFSGTLLFFVLLLSSFCSTSPALLAQGKKPAESGKAPASKTTEGVLATTEQMIEQLIQQIDRQKGNDPETQELADNPNPTSLISSIPNIRPVSGGVTSQFGMRVHPIFNVLLFHSGIDFSAAVGTVVQSTGDGIVAFSGYDKGYGQLVTINHGYGYKTIYAHLSKSLVRQGQQIKRGDIIALSGNTGVSTAPHLHYEVIKDNVKVNPTAYFFDEKTPGKFITIQQKTVPEQSDNHS